MAYVNNISTTAHGAGFSGLFARIAERVARYRVYRETQLELNQLTDRELADLGISRSTIPAVAHEAAYGV
ncbi:DUF1127 domain-containing protein [Celeribacter sp.]|uniref:DUF1127 domain-containing protein n=1 Tax=Celeribacter sp. TaxID=1890673 RepID=UPI003A92BD88